MNQKTKLQINVDVHYPEDTADARVSLSGNGIPIGKPVVKSEFPAPDVETTGWLAQRWRDFRCDANAFPLFLRLLAYAPALLLLTGLLQFLAYRRYFADTPGFAARYGWWLFYLDVSAVALAAVLGYLRSFHLRTSHMLGMMVGMVVGMQAGTMLGAVVGATNGLFVGALAGMGAGVLFGIYIGCRCASTMAVVQGLMSGGMSGTMGAMLIAMMLRDHVLLFMPFFTLANLFILLGFTYLFHEHAVATGECPRRGRDPGFLSMLGLTLLITTLLAWVMIYGPKGPMVWVGEPPPPMDMGGMDMKRPGMDMGNMK